MSKIEQLYSVRDAAELLRVSPYTITSYLSRGRLLRTKLGARTLIRESQLLALLKDGAKSPPPKSLRASQETSATVKPTKSRTHRAK